MLNKKVEFYQKNAKQFLKFLILKRSHLFFESYVTSDEIWTSVGTTKVTTWRIIDIQDVGSPDIDDQLW